MKSNWSGTFLLPSAWCGWVLLVLLVFSPPALADPVDKWDPQIQQAAQNNGVDPNLLKAIVSAESNGNPYATSGKDAYGLGQLLLSTGKQYGLTDANKYDPQANLNASAAYIHHLETLFPNDPQLVIAAYNAGEGAVKNHGNQIPPYKETQNYVNKVDGLYQKYAGKPLDGSAGTPAAGTSPGGTTYNNDMTGLGLELSHFFEELFTELMKITDKITGNLFAEGGQIAAILTLIAVIWTGLQGALKQDPINKLMARLVEVLMICGIALALVQGGFYKDYVQQPIDDTICAVSGRFSHVSGSTDCKSMNSSVKRMTAGITEGMMNIWGSVMAEAHAINPFHSLWSTLKALAPGNFSNTVTLWTLLIIDGLVKIIIIFILLGAMLTCFIVYAMSVILAAIGFALGPVFIPWMILKSTADYTKGWANFVLIAELYKVMAVLIMSIGDPVIIKILSLVCAAGGPDVGGSGTCQPPAGLTATTDAWTFGHLILNVDVPLLIMAVLLAHFMKHAGQWAEGIVNGAAGTSLKVLPWF